MFDDRIWNPVWAVLCLACIVCGAPVASAAGKLAFVAGEKGAYTFDTGVVRGTLCAKGKSSGLTSVVHVPSGTRLDGGSGICGYYRLFTTNKRYGRMAWDWPGRSRLLPDGGFLTVPKSYGDWLMFPRDKAVVSMVRDGRWEKEPYPVQWTIMPEFELPLALRLGYTSALAVVVMAPRDDCFAIAMPYQGETHYSLYLSLFGRDMKAGETAKARTRFLVVSSMLDEDENVLKLYEQYVKSLGASANP